MPNPLHDLHRLGQSIWYDNIRRGLLGSGELKALIDAGEIRGVTSNPTIFEKAIAGSSDYDGALAELAVRGRSTDEIFDALSIEDIRRTTDLFRAVYDQSGGTDGFVSIEVSPLLARNTRSTVAEAERLWRTVDRPNLMVKIPATAEGIPAIEQSLARGININVTLIFSLRRYAEVMQAYLKALERRVAAGQPIDRLASVASFFVSRVDSKVDPRLEALIREEGPHAAQGVRLLGKAAIANAKQAYADFRRTFDSERFERLRRNGAQVQRPLWASTSTKNPAYPDVIYVEALIGPDTVNTVPPATLDAYRDHGQPAVRITEGLDEARAALDELESLGIHMDRVTQELEDEGVAAFSKSFETLMAAIEAKRLALRKRTPQRPSNAQDDWEAAVQARCRALDESRVLDRMWAKDPSLWTDDAAHHAEIRDRLGWLDLPRSMAPQAGEIMAFAREVRQAGFTHVGLLGMGGSSLCPEVLRETFGVGEGGLDLAVLDSTDPAAVRAFERRCDPSHTLFVVASKSGTTIEPNMFLATFWDRVQEAHGSASSRTGQYFVAITDAGTALERLAEERGFRRIFRSPADVGGRYSALSPFGLVPAALIGIDIDMLLQRAQRMLERCRPGMSAADSPGAWLGAAMAEAALGGRDKLTPLASKPLSAFGAWAEQLIAESTGKSGKGILPVDDEPVLPPEGYSSDRLFVYLRLGSKLDRKARALRQAGHPVVTLDLQDAYDLGAEFYRWEVATAVAAAALRIDPFDQPNVQEAKDHTAKLLRTFIEKGELPASRRLWSRGGITLYGRSGTNVRAARTLEQALAAHLQRVRPGDYVSLNAFLARTPATDAALRAARKAVVEELRVATTAGYGPRYLHSTGQFHKGGPNSGVFIMVTADPVRDLNIPGEAITFGVLERAQALGDVQALVAKKRRILHVHLEHPRDIRALATAVARAAERVARTKRTGHRSRSGR